MISQVPTKIIRRKKNGGAVCGDFGDVVAELSFVMPHWTGQII
jgi:hypothetical protein